MMSHSMRRCVASTVSPYLYRTAHFLHVEAQKQHVRVQVDVAQLSLR